MPVPEWAKPIESQGVPSWAKPIEQPPSVQSVEQDDSILSVLSKRIDKTKEMVDRNELDTIGGFAHNAPKVAALATGQAAGAGVDLIGHAVGKMADAVLPDKLRQFAKEKFSELIQTDIGQKAMSALQQGQESWDNFSKEHPDEAMGLEGIFNMAAFGVAKKGAAVVEKEAVDIASDFGNAAYKMRPKEIDRAILSEVKKGIQKGARPGVEGKRTFSQAEGYFKKANTAVEAIIENKSALNLTNNVGEKVSGKLPESLSEFSQAISQTKSTIFKQYDDLAKNTVGEIDTSNIVKELRKISANKSTSVSSPQAAKHAEALAKRLEDAGNLTATEAQDIIQNFNTMLSAYYQNPNRASAVKNIIDATVANNLRKNLDDLIESATGAGYQSLKNQYGALKAIERDVNRRMIVDGRKEIKGLIDFSDFFSGSEAIRAIISKNPAALAGAATTKGIASYYKRLKDPNKAIKQMFESVENLQAKRRGFEPKSVTAKSVVAAKENLDKLNQAKNAQTNVLGNYKPF